MAVGFVNSLGLSFPLIGSYGGTGVNNGTNTLTISANSSINQDVTTTGTPTFARAYAANFVNGYSTTATAAGTTVLTVASNQQQFFTGATTQTVTLPVVSTLVLGHTFLIVNNSSGVVTVESSGGNAVQAMSAGTQLVVTCILTSGTTAASWNAEYSSSTGGVISVSGTSNRITVTGTSNVTVDIAATYVGQTSITTLGTVVTGTWNATTIDVAHGGTGATSFVAFAPVIGGSSATNPLASADTGISNSGYVLTSTGAASAPTWQAPAPLAFVSVAGTTQAAVKNTAYGLQNAAQVTLTLPASGGLSVGDIIKVEGYGAAGFIIQAAASQVINAYGGRNTTAAGTVTTSDPLNTTSSAPGCAITLRYTAANTFWMVEDVGNFVFA